MVESQGRWESPEQWSQWVEWLSAGLHGRSRWRLSIVLLGMLFAGGRRTVTAWLRAAGVSDEYQDYYYFIAALGCNAKFVAARLVVLLLAQLPLGERVLLVIDDSPTKRYGPKVEGAAVHHNPTPGPADQPFLYGHVWVTLSLTLRHPLFRAIALPLRAMLYVRQQTIPKIPARRRWPAFATKLQLAARLVEWIMPMVRAVGKTTWVVVDGGYVKRAFLRPTLDAGATIVGRLRKDAALRDVPRAIAPGQRKRGRPRKYGAAAISLAKRAGQSRGWQTIECTLYGKPVAKQGKTFLATYAPVGGVIRVVLVKEAHGWFAFFCSDPHATAAEILEAFADRATIEQDFHDVKEVWGAGQQQVRNIWTSVGAFNLNLWMHTLVELWAWRRPHDELADRQDSPWDDADRRPSHANRRKALRRLILERQLSALAATSSLPNKILDLTKTLIALAA